MLIQTDSYVTLELVRHSPMEWAKIQTPRQTIMLTQLQLSDLAVALDMVRATERGGSDDRG